MTFYFQLFSELEGNDPIIERSSKELFIVLSSSFLVCDF